MPAGSEPVRLPHTWRPFGARVAGVLFGGMLLVVCAAAWFGFDDETRAKFTVFQRGTLVFLGLLAFSAWFALVRSRVVATTDRLVVVNGYRHHEYDWAEIIAVRLPPGAPWVTLDLADGTTASALAIQGSDGGRAQRAVRTLRTLVAASSASRDS
ncbi:PH domain-containing protein [Nocardioides sp. KIGAM211]|uniref:PH domain-containing protein n=1 Tax=Nocardioides luti TaxID=2761101 RepID=A0A7X0RJF5_9ACTN|nr:PH domain-containing protein [Nocardioides luti]MBB6629446.1 PH domain-containing protein [Nocardioides luti]